MVHPRNVRIAGPIGKALAFSMKTAVILLNFGEPEEATLEAVTPFLERIFNLNRDLEQHANADAAAARSRRLAAARAPGLVAEYLEIGGSPLHNQARDQAAALQDELHRRGLDAVVVLGMQFTEPSIEVAITAARAAGATEIVGLPVYPLCGPTTTVAALAQLSAAAAPAQLAVREISGWHRHPEYIRFRARMISDAARAGGVSLTDPRVHLVFSAHGTPIKYLNEGSRYEEYVRDCCARVAAALGTTNYTIGYQNHSNRPLEWTQPAVDEVIDSLDADHVVVDAISFMHEQSETLAELDHELREHAEARGLAFHRVPIAHEDPEFIAILADLVCNNVDGEKLRSCQCRPGAFCLNRR
jgi:ferrochelatase